MLHRILTEDVYREAIYDILDSHVDGYMVTPGTGSWRGVRENSLAIDLVGVPAITVQNIAREIKRRTTNSSKINYLTAQAKTEREEPMKLEIFKTPSVTEEPVRLILEASGSGITVRAVDSKGYPFPTGRLVTITPEGIIFNGGVNPALGFPLDDTGRLRLRRV